MVDASITTYAPFGVRSTRFPYPTPRGLAATSPPYQTPLPKTQLGLSVVSVLRVDALCPRVDLQPSLRHLGVPQERLGHPDQVALDLGQLLPCVLGRHELVVDVARLDAARRQISVVVVKRFDCRCVSNSMTSRCHNHQETYCGHPGPHGRDGGTGWCSYRPGQSRSTTARRPWGPRQTCSSRPG